VSFSANRRSVPTAPSIRIRAQLRPSARPHIGSFSLNETSGLSCPTGGMRFNVWSSPADIMTSHTQKRQSRESTRKEVSSRVLLNRAVIDHRDMPRPQVNGVIPWGLPHWCSRSGQTCVIHDPYELRGLSHAVRDPTGENDPCCAKHYAGMVISGERFARGEAVPTTSA
jgi:hypothetical protein